jgi:hypothetical protein
MVGIQQWYSLSCWHTGHGASPLKRVSRRRADSRGLVIPCDIQRRRYHPSSSLGSTQPLLSHRIILKEMGSSSLEIIRFTSSPNPTLLQSWPLVGQQVWDQKPARAVAGILYRSQQGRSRTLSLPWRDGHYPFRGEPSNGCMCNPHLVSRCGNRGPWLGSRVGVRNPPGASQVVSQLLQGIFIEVSKVDYGGNPFLGELNNSCMWNPHLVFVLEESCRLCSCQDHGVGMVAFVVDGCDKLMKYFLIRNMFLHQHEIKL